MKSIDYQEYIEDYLSGNLEGDLLKSFERAMQNNPELAKRVRTIQEMTKVLGNKKKNELRDSLSELRTEYSSDSKIKLDYPIIISLSIILVFGVAWAVSYMKGNSNEQSPKIEKIEIAPTETPERDTVKQKPANPPEQKPKENKPTKSKSTKPKEPTKSRPIAAADPKFFEPIALLESMVFENVRSNVEVTNLFPPNDYVFKKEGNTLELTFSGSLNNYAQDSIELFVFNNNEVAFNFGKFVLYEKLKLENSAQFEYHFNGNIHKGLFYFYLKENGGREIYYTGKFFIR